MATGSALVPGLTGTDPCIGSRLVGTGLHASEVRIKQVEDAIRSAVPLGDKGAGLRVHENDFRLILEFGIPALQDVSIRNGPFWECRVQIEEESDSALCEEGGSILTSSATVSHHAIEIGENLIGGIGRNHSIDILAVEGIFDDAIARDLGMFRDQMVIAFSAGSRGFGKQVSEEYTRLARDICGDHAPERSPSFINTDRPESEAYIQALRCAGNFALVNRQVITAIIRHAVRRVIGEKGMPLICDCPGSSLRKERYGQRDVYVHRSSACAVIPDEKRGYKMPDRVCILSGSPPGGTYLITAGDSSNQTLNSLSVSTGHDEIMSKTSSQGSHGRKERSSDEIARCLVDAGVARIIARMRRLASVQP